MKKRFIFFILFVFMFTTATPTVIGATSKTPTIAELQKKIAVLTKQVASLTASLTQKNKENTALKKDKTNLQNQIKSKQNEINTLKSSNENKDDIINDKDSIIKEKDKQIEQLKLLSTAEITYTNEYLNSGNNVKWYKFKTRYTTLYFTQKAFEEHNYIVNVADNILEDVSHYFGVNKPENTATYIYTNGDVSLRETYANYDFNTKRIVINSSSYYPISSRNKEDLVSVFVHEYSHSFQAESLQLFGRGISVRWLTEGMADYVDHQFIDYKKYNIPSKYLFNNKTNKESFKEKIKNNLQYNNEEVFTKLPLNNENHVGYDSYESIIYFLENTYGHAKVMDFLLEAFKTPNAGEAVKNVFGIDEYQLMKQWREYFSL